MSLPSYEIVGPDSAGALLRRYRVAPVEPQDWEICGHCNVLVSGAHSCEPGIAASNVLPSKRRKRV